MKKKSIEDIMTDHDRMIWSENYVTKDSIDQDKLKNAEKLQLQMYDEFIKRQVKAMNMEPKQINSILKIMEERTRLDVPQSKKKRKRIIRNILVSPLMLLGVIPDLLKYPVVFLFWTAWKICDLNEGKKVPVPYPEGWRVCTQMMYYSLYVKR